MWITIWKVRTIDSLPWLVESSDIYCIPLHNPSSSLSMCLCVCVRSTMESESLINAFGSFQSTCGMHRWTYSDGGIVSNAYALDFSLSLSLSLVRFSICHLSGFIEMVGTKMSGLLLPRVWHIKLHSIQLVWLSVNQNISHEMEWLRDLQ